MATPTTTTAPASFFVPFPMAPAHRTTQEPKSTTDTPVSPTPSGAAPGAGTTQTPGTPAGPAAAAGPCGMDPTTMLMLAGMFAVLYFVMIRPENKRRKQQQAMLAAIKTGDHVVTLGGMHGTVASLADKTVTLRIDTQKVVFDRTAIARVERDEGPAIENKKS